MPPSSEMRSALWYTPLARPVSLGRTCSARIPSIEPPPDAIAGAEAGAGAGAALGSGAARPPVRAALPPASERAPQRRCCGRRRRRSGCRRRTSSRPFGSLGQPARRGLAPPVLPLRSREPAGTRWRKTRDSGRSYETKGAMPQPAALRQPGPGDGRDGSRGGWGPPPASAFSSAGREPPAPPATRRRPRGRASPAPPRGGCGGRVLSASPGAGRHPRPPGRGQRDRRAGRPTPAPACSAGGRSPSGAPIRRRNTSSGAEPAALSKVLELAARPVLTLAIRN